MQRFLNFSLEVQPVEKFFENSDVHILTRNFVRMRLEQTAIFNFPETSGLSFFYFAFYHFASKLRLSNDIVKIKFHSGEPNPSLFGCSKSEKRRDEKERKKKRKKEKKRIISRNRQWLYIRQRYSNFRVTWNLASKQPFFRSTCVDQFSSKVRKILIKSENCQPAFSNVTDYHMINFLTCLVRKLKFVCSNSIGI